MAARPPPTPTFGTRPLRSRVSFCSHSLHTPFLPYVTPHSSYTSHLNRFFSLSLHTPFLPISHTPFFPSLTCKSCFQSRVIFLFSLSLHTPFLPYVTPHSSHISHFKFAFSVRRIGRCGHADWTAEGRRRARTARGRAALGPRVLRLPKVLNEHPVLATEKACFQSLP